MTLAGEGVAASSLPLRDRQHSVGACVCGWPLSCGAGHTEDGVVCWPSFLAGGASGFQCRPQPMPIQWPSPCSQWAKPLACHVTSTVLSVTSRRRSLFGSAAWCHPHPSVTQNVAQPAASGSSPVVDMIGRMERRGLLVSQLLLAPTPLLPLWLLGGLTLPLSLGSAGGRWQLCPWRTWESTLLLTH